MTKLNFGIMCGVGAILSGRIFQKSIILVVIRSPLLQMFCTFLTRGFNEIFFFQELPKIGK